MSNVRERAYLELCRAYDGLLEADAPAASERVQRELAAYARVLDLDVGDAEAPEIWRRVRPLIAAQFGEDAGRLASTAPDLEPKIYVPATAGRPGLFSSGQDALSLLVVEDDPELGSAMVEALGEAGHRVVGHAASADLALNLAALHQVDLAIVDVELADGSSGVELAEHLHGRWGTPALFISGGQNEHLVCHDLPIGFLGKPFRAVELLAAVTLAAPLLTRASGRADQTLA